MSEILNPTKFVIEPNFMPYVSSQSENLTSEYSSEDGVYTVFSKLPIVFVYNKKLLNAAAAPRSWEELLDYRWKGKIAFASPKVSGSSYTAVSAMVQILNPRLKTDDTLKKFTANLDGNESTSSGAVVSDVISGKRTIGIALEDVVKKAMETNADLAIIYPKEGTPVLPDGCAIVKDAPHTDNAVLFIEFCVSEDVQHYLEENLYRYSVRTDLAKPIPCSEYVYDLEEAENLRDLIFTTWEQEVEK